MLMRVLGVDYGERRIGIAVSDPTGTLARPCRSLSGAGSLAERVAAVAAEAVVFAAEADGLTAVVVGLPRRLDGRPNEQTTRVLAFAEALRAATGLPITTQDERLTSIEAEQRLAEREASWRRRKTQLDAASAAIILQDYLDQRVEARRSGFENVEGSGR